MMDAASTKSLVKVHAFTSLFADRGKFAVADTSQPADTNRTYRGGRQVHFKGSSSRQFAARRCRHDSCIRDQELKVLAQVTELLVTGRRSGSRVDLVAGFRV